MYDKHLSCKFQIQNTTKKIQTESVGIIYKSSFCLNKISLCTLYYILVYDSCLHYCASIWGSTYRSNLKALITLPKRVIRILSRITFNARIEPTLVKLILKSENIIKLQIRKVMYLYKNRLHPESFNDMFFI